MSDEETRRTVEAALAAARIRAIRTGLMELHKMLLDAERARYERDRGPIGGPHDALRLAMSDPSFAWLRPMLQLIVTADERLAAGEPVTSDDARAYAASVRDLLRGEDGGADFRAAYNQALQDLPDVVVLHGGVLAAVRETETR